MRTQTQTQTQTQTHRTRTLLALGTAAIIATAGAGVVMTASHDDAATGLGDDDRSAADGAVLRLRGHGAEDATGPCAFSVGTRMAYEVHTETEIALDLGTLSDEIELGSAHAAVDATPAQARVASRRWHLDLETIAVDEDGARVLAASIQDHGGEIDGTDPVPAVPELANAFLVRVAPRCSIREFGWRTEGDRDVARQQQLLTAALGFLAPTKAGAVVYGGTTFDDTGRYHATYRTEDGRTLEGRIVEVQLPLVATRGMAALEMDVVDSSIDVELAEGTWFSSLTNRRALSMTMGEQAVGSHRRATAAQLAAPTGWRPRVDLADGGWSWGLLLGQGRETSDLEVAESVATLSLDEAVDRYRQLIADGASTATYTGLLRDWIKAHPEGATSLVSQLRAGAFDGEQRARSGLFYALGTADVPQARAVLVELLDGEPDRAAYRIAAAYALAQGREPTAEMVDSMAAFAERSELHAAERSSMAMALGMLAERSADQAPEVAAAARDRIRDWLDQPADTQQLGHSLMAAGNAAHDGLADAVTAYLEDQTPEIRQRAAHALRGMSPEAAFPGLEKALFDDDRTVRMRALASATTVSRQHQVSPPGEMVEMALDWLDGATPGEERALLSLLGEAARRGNARARDALQEQLSTALHAEDRDPRRLAALGRTMGGHWQAEG